ncbi:O-antigen ligase family protein [Brevundimonas sp.]|uniref:O-antigen ligase family protein n=1 Tax=Brevundimonas sp. TaxID=1871086 RepID=UPI002627F0DD|nr:O-antigen ligase family protein [Brevundimonas sp.]
MTLASHVLRWIFALSAAGYAIVALTALSIGVESRPLAVGLRVLVALMSGVAVLLFAKGSISTRPPVAFVAFLLLYMGRLIWDIQSFGEAPENLQFYIVVVIAPALAALMISDQWNDLSSAKLFSIIGMLGCLFLILASILGFSEWRSTTENAAGRFSYDVLDPITVGNLGAATAIAAFCVYRVTRAPWTLACLALGFIALIMGLSRGPMVSLLGCVAVYLWLTGRTLALLAALLVATAFLFTGYGDALFEYLRFGDIENDEAANIRVDVVMSSIEQFAGSPLIGSGHVDKVTGYYPHNVFVESAIALGVVGIILIIFLFWRSWCVGVKRARSGEMFAFLTLVYWMIEVQFSGAIWSNVMLWLSMAIVLSSRSVAQIPASHSVNKIRTKPMFFRRGAVSG